MKTEIKYISTELARMRSKVIYHTWHFQFQSCIFAKDRIFRLLSSNIYTEKIYIHIYMRMENYGVCK
jgi:hypothetical protein